MIYRFSWFDMKKTNLWNDFAGHFALIWYNANA